MLERHARADPARGDFQAAPSDGFRSLLRQRPPRRGLVQHDGRPGPGQRADVGGRSESPRFGSVISDLMRDTGTLMAERSDRHDLAVGLLEKARKYRPNAPRLLWALARTYRMVARTDEKQAEADSLLAAAAEQDKRRIYPAIHRDIAYAMASRKPTLRPPSNGVAIEIRTFVRRSSILG